MYRGYIKLWRKVLDNPILHERGKRYSKFEAWVYLCLSASGTDTDNLKRGEFKASVRFLAAAWNWGRGVVERFMRDLQEGPRPMIMRVGHQTGQETGQQTGQFEGHFIICNYGLYNPKRDSKQDTKRDTSRDTKQDKYNEYSNELFNEKVNEQSSSNLKSGSQKTKDPRYGPLKEFIEAKYQEVRGVKLISDKTDWICFSNMLKTTNGNFTQETLENAWTLFLLSPSQYHQSQGHPLRWWCANLNGFIGKHQRAPVYDIHDRNMDVIQRFVARGKDDE